MRTELFIPVGVANGAVLLEGDASRFARCGQDMKQARLDAQLEELFRNSQKRELESYRRKSTPISRGIYAESKSGKRQKDIATERGLSAWQVKEMIRRERALEVKA